MSNVKQLRQRRADISKKIRAIHDKVVSENRQRDDSETKEYEKFKAEFNANEELLVLEEEQLERERNIQGVADENDLAAQRAGRTGQQATATQKNGGFATFGEYLIAVAASSSPGGRVDPRLMQATASGMNESVPSDGGFAVFPDIERQILLRMHDMGQILQRVRTVPVAGDGLKMNAVDETSRVDGSRWGGVQAYWANEADTVSGKKPKFRQMELHLNKIFALYYATDELIADAAALGPIVEQAFSEELVFKVEDAIVEGDGSGKPLGIINGGSLLSVAKETSQVAATVVIENVIKMYSRMTPRSIANAVWLMNQDVLPQLPLFNVKVKNVAGSENVGGIIPPDVYRPSDGAYGSLMGRPIVITEYCSTLGTKGDIIFADLSQYLLINKGAPQAASSMHVRFLNDEMTYRITQRVDGQPIWTKALTPFKGSNTTSPFVTLDARS